MYTQCPQCGSYFHVRDRDLQAADGNVRCSVCATTFNALKHLHEQLPDDQLEEGGQAAENDDSPTLDLFANLPARERPHPGEDAATTTPAWLHEEDAPRLGERHPLLWTAGSILMLILLGVQLLHAEREHWSEHPTLGPWVTAAYEALGQPLPEPRSLEALEIRRADIASGADDPSRLRVTAVVENVSDQGQPLPAVYIRLEDRWGMNMGYGFFLPEEWIHREQLPREFAPRTRLPARVELLDPSREAISFHMELCWIEEAGFACRPQRGGAAFVR